MYWFRHLTAPSCADPRLRKFMGPRKYDAISAALRSELSAGAGNFAPCEFAALTEGNTREPRPVFLSERANDSPL